jgi:selenide,water dikinase
VEKLPAALARQVLEGARFTCAAAGIPLAGGHSIDATEPVFGLSVSGICTEDQLRRNDTAREGDWIMLSKPIGTGILSAANKRGLIEEQHLLEGIGLMTALNKLGLLLGAETAVTAMTDVTGFGLLGHLMEMAEGANLSAEIFYDRIPLVAGARLYLAQRIVPDATYRNWNRYSAETGFEKGVNVMEAFNLLPDPQTNGGLLFTVADEHLPQVQALLRAEGYGDFCLPIGRMTTKGNKRVQVLVG